MVRNLDPEKRTSLLNAALKLFVAQGAASTTTAQVAREAGTAAGTLFLYFSTKQALLDELILSIAEEQTRAIEQRLDPTLSARDSFFAIWHASLTWFIDHLDAYLFVQQVRDTGMISPAAVEKSNTIFGFYYTAIQKGLTENALKPLPLDLIGAFLYQDIVAVMNHIRREPDPARYEALIAQGFEIFWDGICAARSSTQEELK